MEAIKVGIIGQGRSGRDIHGVYLATDARYKIVAVADTIADRRTRAVSEYGCEAHADYRELLARKDIDLVVNASFSHQHVPITREALLAGHHVLCEKPFARRVADVDDLITTAEKAGKTLAIFQQARFAPYFKTVQQVIASGVLGRIMQISVSFNNHSRRWDWQTLTEFDGGNLLNTGPHPMDQALTLFGDGDPEVWCRMDNSEGFSGDAENYVKLILTGKGKPLIDIEISSCCAYPEGLYQVYGSRGGLRASASEAAWRYIDPAAPATPALQRAPLAREDGTPAYCGEKINWITQSWPEAKEGDAAASADYAPAKPDTNMTGEFYGMLHGVLTKGAPLEITPQQIRRQMAVVEACRRQNPAIYPNG